MAWVRIKESRVPHHMPRYAVCALQAAGLFIHTRLLMLCHLIYLPQGVGSAARSEQRALAACPPGGSSGSSNKTTVRCVAWAVHSAKGCSSLLRSEPAFLCGCFPVERCSSPVLSQGATRGRGRAPGSKPTLGSGSTSAASRLGCSCLCFRLGLWSSRSCSRSSHSFSRCGQSPFLFAEVAAAAARSPPTVDNARRRV